MRYCIQVPAAMATNAVYTISMDLYYFAYARHATERK